MSKADGASHCIGTCSSLRSLTGRNQPQGCNAAAPHAWLLVSTPPTSPRSNVFFWYLGFAIFVHRTNTCDVLDIDLPRCRGISTSLTSNVTPPKPSPALVFILVFGKYSRTPLSPNHVIIVRSGQRVLDRSRLSSAGSREIKSHEVVQIALPPALHSFPESTSERMFDKILLRSF